VLVLWTVGHDDHGAVDRDIPENSEKGLDTLIFMRDYKGGL
jgi:hypothetical protein